MKSYRVIIVLVAFSLGTNAQKIKEDAVPSAVRDGLKATYKDVKVEKWEKENDGYEAEFDFQKKEYSVFLNAAGHILETEIEIPVSDLPIGVKEYVNTHHKGMTIKEASMITDVTGLVSYEAEVGKEDLIFDSSGTFLKKEMDSEEKDKD